nr:MSMEG_6728 family protein [Motilibacter aurantiacus]
MVPPAGGYDAQVQTFLPYPDFVASAQALDDKRLGKQRVETFQILRALVWPQYGWKNHPATRMWRGFTPALVAYGLATCDVWERRGRAEATRASLLAFTGGREPQWEQLLEQGQLPPWLGEEAFHLSHRSALLRKEPEYYRDRFPGTPDDLDYLWPAPAFPRWPIRRGREKELPVYAALELLGRAEATEEQEKAVWALQDGEDAELTLTQESEVTASGLLAGLCTPGATLWVRRGPALPHSPGAHEPHRPPAPGAKTSASIAKPPTPDAVAAMEAEATAEPEFRFLRPASVTRASAKGAGLVVVDVDDDEPPVELPALGLPVLTLRGARPEERPA